MADIYTSDKDEKCIGDIRRHGLNQPEIPKLKALRIALALSLKIPTHPDEELDHIDANVKGSEYERTRVTGVGLKADDKGGRQDFDHAIRALLSVYHKEDLFQEVNGDKRFNQLLQRHVRRGLREIRTTWRPGHDFHSFLYHELFSGGEVPVPHVDRSEELLKGLLEVGVSARLEEVIEGPRISRYRVYLDDINHLDRIHRSLDKLGLHLGLQQHGIFLAEDSEPRVVSLDVPRPRETWQTVPGARIKGWATQAEPDEGALRVWPGVDVLGDPFSFDLSDCPHLLVAGTTGSGKSVCIHTMLLSLLWALGPNQLKLLLIDPKKVEFAHYSGLPHLVSGQVFDEIESAHERLEWAVGEMERRTQLLKEAGVSNLEDARASGLLSLPSILIVVEELADLMYQSRETEEPLVRLAQKARAVGIHLMLATQRPDSVTFSGLLRSNIPARIALSVQKSTESKIILDDTGAERLLGHGDMLIKPHPGAEPIRIHGAYVTRDDILACVKSARGGGR